MSKTRKFQVGDYARVKKINKIGIVDQYAICSAASYYRVKFSDEKDQCHNGYYRPNQLDTVEITIDPTPDDKSCNICTELNQPEVSIISNHQHNTINSSISDNQLKRMAEELEELTDRLNRLDKFMSSSSFNSIDELSKSELVIQAHSMKIYHNVLASRYNRLMSSNTNHAIFMD